MRAACERSKGGVGNSLNPFRVKATYAYVGTTQGWRDFLLQRLGKASVVNELKVMTRYEDWSEMNEPLLCALVKVAELKEEGTIDWNEATVAIGWIAKSMTARLARSDPQASKINKQR